MRFEIDWLIVKCFAIISAPFILGITVRAIGELYAKIYKYFFVKRIVELSSQLAKETKRGLK